MAISPFLQMYFGRPKILIEFVTDWIDGSKLLGGQISNPPLLHPLARFLALHRETAEDVWVVFEINEDKTGKVIVPAIFPDLTREDMPPARRITLPSSIRIARFPIALYNPSSKQAKLVDNANAIVLPTGQYIVIIKVCVFGKKVLAKRCLTVYTDGNLRWSAN